MSSTPTPAAPAFTIGALDHLVLYARDVDASIAFYTRQLGMRYQAFTSAAAAGGEGEVRHALLFGAQKINLHAASSPYAPHASSPLPGTADFCLLTDTPVERVAEALAAGGVRLLRFGALGEEVGDGEGKGTEDGAEGEEGDVVVQRTGARGKLRSVYVRDPDGNLVEISNYV
ncbi:Glyoxalase/Bleomycin resistance protein/Dihydroxybiphenyl dioxygenase [Phyllosticta citribraziliensis]|uniref:Glyoxalase/Bleomycin resistance protein/Dihydroxybiphenyl dioxygenase n=1 Tax=Phyllosticta citribraziliensis TaxID=989973 RepID=A0ABR1LF28_9PEZI